MILVDGPASVSGDQWLAQLNRPEDGVVSVVAEPVSHRSWALVSAILGRLGQHEAAQGATKNDQLMLRIWMEAYGIEDVILNHADHYPADVLVDLDTVLTATGATLWLIVEPALLEATAAHLEGVLAKPTRLDWTAFEQQCLDRPERVGDPEVTTTISVVAAPEGNGTLAKRRPPAPADLQDWRYLAGFCAIANDSETFRPYARKGVGSSMSVRQTQQRVAARIRGLSESYVDPVCSSRAIRGCAVALRRIGWKVIVDEDDLTVLADAKSEPKLTDPGRLRHMRRFRDPLVSAVAALATLELAVEEIARIRIQDVDGDGSIVRVEKECLDVPIVLRPFLRAQRIHRLLKGSALTDSYTAKKEGSLTTRSIAPLAGVGLGLAKGSRSWNDVAAAPTRNERWLAEHGVKIHRIVNVKALTTDRIESDRLLRKAIEALRSGTRAPEPCECPLGHARPKLLNATFGAYGGVHPVGKDHVWRTAW